ncbi:sugar ABC transporter permease [Paenibacillus campi]|uniref:carbohydrate ABC transporter permease n=1 Tax=Paenibacillus campi TaxID=3106031 RepID=UPI002AFE09B1|nr:MULTISPECIES: sugar ABC transporter permease [unclassified Paenibacillus]
MDRERSRIRLPRRTGRLQEYSLAALFLAPSVALFSIFLFYPLVQSVYLSLHSTTPRGDVAKYIGLRNFERLFEASGFLNSLWVTVQFMLFTVPTSIVLALILAAICRTHLRGSKVFRFIFSLPLAISVGTGSVIWMMLFHPTLGMPNYLLQLIGLPGIQWLTSPNWALISISIMTVWMNVGFLFILLLGGMEGVSEEIYESARMDGAGPLLTFFRLTLPLISPTLFFATVTSIISAFQSFGQINILTKGGPVNSTNVLVFNLYQDAFVNFRFGSGSAQALVLFVLILILTIIQFKFGEKKVHYQ